MNFARGRHGVFGLVVVGFVRCSVISAVVLDLYGDTPLIYAFGGTRLPIYSIINVVAPAPIAIGDAIAVAVDSAAYIDRASRSPRHPNAILHAAIC